MLFDCTMRLENGMPVYPGDTAFTAKTVKSTKEDGYMLTDVSMCVHNGTHVDAPAHYIEGGKTIDQMPLSLMVGPAEAFMEIESIPDGLQRCVLLFDREIGLTEAQRLIDRGVKLVLTGMNTIGNDEVHQLLLKNEVWIAENVVTSHIQPGRYRLYCLPMLIAGAEASPARVLMEKL